MNAVRAQQTQQDRLHDGSPVGEAEFGAEADETLDEAQPDHRAGATAQTTLLGQGETRDFAARPGRQVAQKACVNGCL